jgi:hypothetical protein
MTKQIKSIGLLAALAFAASTAAFLVFSDEPITAASALHVVLPAAQVQQEQAQDQMRGMDMSGAVNQVIDGTTDSDKIKDVDAWKMFLLNLASASSYDDTRWMFRDSTLTDEQADQIQQIVVDFNQKFTAANDQYNVVADTNGRTGADNKDNLKSKNLLKIMGLLVLLCSFAGAASAQTSCITPHFSGFVSQVANIPTAGDPNGQVVSVTQTVTSSGYSTLTSPCTVMSTTGVQHWITVTNRLTLGSTQYGGITASARNCPTCTFNLTTTTPSANYTYYDGGNIDVGSDDSMDWFCSSAGHFGSAGVTGGGGGGTMVHRLLRLLTGASIPDSTRAATQCSQSRFNNGYVTICNVPTQAYCKVLTPDGRPLIPAINPSNIRAIWLPTVIPPPARWWRTWDECYRLLPSNIVPWNCPEITFTIPYTNVGIKTPLAWDQYTQPPLGGYWCDDKYLP